MTHPEFQLPADCDPNPGNESFTDEEFFEFYGDVEDEIVNDLFRPLSEEEALEELYNRG